MIGCGGGAGAAEAPRLVSAIPIIAIAATAGALWWNAICRGTGLLPFAFSGKEAQLFHRCRARDKAAWYAVPDRVRKCPLLMSAGHVLAAGRRGADPTGRPVGPGQASGGRRRRRGCRPTARPARAPRRNRFRKALAEPGGHL